MSNEIDKFRNLFPGLKSRLTWAKIKLLKEAFFKNGVEISGNETLNIEECEAAIKSLKQSLSETEKEGM